MTEPPAIGSYANGQWHKYAVFYVRSVVNKPDIASGLLLVTYETTWILMDLLRAVRISCC